MLELGISQAQAQFTKLLTQTVFIVDKKAHQKKAVIMPYSEYEKLIKQASSKDNLSDGGFNKFVGILDNSFQTDDEKYNEIIK
ncbi:type II toxin-antitoxin system Phd/YefM family antitoxin [Arcobacter vandammei]|uniref:type II toxin-antitoxin system Phd/YefM family antitoxin n=1 Tax=Arcobacter vandammei TaxID=2782243 RepID=UPI0018DFAEEC|nr:type II toxin-antitoxin system Phd/YefM family antitoxin [Arcobacter vandammei]